MIEPKFSIEQEVWHIVNGFIVNGFVKSVTANKEGLFYEVYPTQSGFQNRKEAEIFATREEAEASRGENGGS